MKLVEITIKGRTPLLMHRFPLEPEAGLEKKTKAEQAEVAAYRHPENGNLMIPAEALQRTLVNGGTFIKGKGRASLQKVIAACVFIAPVYLDLGIKGYAIDERAVVIPSTRGRVIRFRPRVDEWCVTFILEYDEILLSEAQVRDVLDAAGSRVGLLDFRPQKNGPFGRFFVARWEAQK